MAPLALRTVEHFSRRLGRRARLSPPAMAELQGYDWPGNVRELQNVLERAVLLVRGDVIESLDLPAPRAAPAVARGAPPAGGVETLRSAVERAERDAIQAALRFTGDNKARAAELLGVSVRTLWYRLERLGLGGPPPPAE